MSGAAVTFGGAVSLAWPGATVDIEAGGLLVVPAWWTAAGAYAPPGEDEA